MERAAHDASTASHRDYNRPSSHDNMTTERMEQKTRSSQDGEKNINIEQRKEKRKLSDVDDKEEETAKIPRERLRDEHADSETETLTHAELLELTSSTLGALLKGDTIMSDLPSDVTVEEVAAQIALAQGQSMTVTVVREDGVDLNVVVAQSGNVLDLKRAVQRHVTLKLRREGRSHVQINWRYVWRSNWLSLADGTKLTQETAKLSDVGVRNRSKVKFVKRLDEKHRIQ